MSDSFFKEHWDRQKRERINSRALGGIRVRQVATRIQVSVPYNAEFITGARQLGARWRRRAGFWSFPDSQASSLQTLIKEVYGVDI